MTHILVHDLILGEDAITVDAGLRVHDAVRSHIDRNEPVRLDFVSVTTFASLFFNAAVGQLLSKYSPEELQRNVEFVNLGPTGASVLQSVIENAKRFYAEPDYRKAQAKALAAIAEGA